MMHGDGILLCRAYLKEHDELRRVGNLSIFNSQAVTGRANR